MVELSDRLRFAASGMSGSADSTTVAERLAQASAAAAAR